MMIILACFGFFCLINQTEAASGEQGNEILIIGSSRIFEENMARARKEALRDAMFKGIERYLISRLGKQRMSDNFVLLSKLEAFVRLGFPLLVGPSRKSFIGWALDVPENDRLMGTASAVAAAVLNGAHIVRVHDVKEMHQVVKIADRIMHAKTNREYQGYLS